MDTIIYVVVGLVVALLIGLVLAKRKADPGARSEASSSSNAGQLSAEDVGANAARSTGASDTAGLRGVSSHAKPATAEDRSKGETAPASTREARPATASADVGRVPDSSRQIPAEAPRPSRMPRAGDGVQRMRAGLARSREDGGFFGRIKGLLFGPAQLPADLSAQLEEVLLNSDVGVATTRVILDRVEADLTRSSAGDPSAVWGALRAEATRILSVDGTAGPLLLDKQPTVVLFVGVNGAGKTTTIGKLATKFKAEGKTCVLAAGDTFRAAAVQQLTIWGQRVGCEVVRGKDGADPGSVVFDAIKRAQELGADVVLADTAGRLHTKANLMSEMQKIARTAAKALPGAPHEVLLVIDATNGQNALAQAREFKESLELGGIVLTKLDGTAKGGVILGIADTLKVPVRYVGLGERPDDLHEFVPEDFVEALLGRDTAGKDVVPVKDSSLVSKDAGHDSVNAGHASAESGHAGLESAPAGKETGSSEKDAV